MFGVMLFRRTMWLFCLLAATLFHSAMAQGGVVKDSQADSGLSLAQGGPQIEQQDPLVKEEPGIGHDSTWMDAYPDIDNTTIPTPDKFQAVACSGGRPPQIPISTSIHCATAACGGANIGNNQVISQAQWDAGQYLKGQKPAVKLIQVPKSSLRTAFYIRWASGSAFTIRAKVAPGDAICVTPDRMGKNALVLGPCDDVDYQTNAQLPRFWIECQQCLANGQNIRSTGWTYATKCHIKEDRSLYRCVVGNPNGQLTFGTCDGNALWALRSY